MIVCAELKRRHQDVFYWSAKKEVDFISSELVEVKYQNRVTATEFFCFEKQMPKQLKLTVLTKNDSFKQGRVTGIPLKDWLILYQ